LAQNFRNSLPGTNVTPVQAMAPGTMVPTPQTASTLQGAPVMPGYPQPYSTLAAPATGLPTQTGYAIPEGFEGPYGGGISGPITYETYIRTGPSILAGNGTWTNRAKSGWNTGAGFKTLLFNPTNDAAWVLDLGVSYTRNNGQRDNPVLVDSTQLRGADLDNPFLDNLRIKGLSRTTFNYSIGRDWWLNGPGTVPNEFAGNLRFGADVGGRWGTASVDFEPVNEPGGYRRIQRVVHGLFIGSHLNWERSMGNFIFFAGLRGEFSYTWMNILPPNNSDIMDVNILMNFGFRF
jgi:hypothetical protein